MTIFTVLVQSHRHLIVFLGKNFLNYFASFPLCNLEGQLTQTALCVCEEFVEDSFAEIKGQIVVQLMVEKSLSLHFNPV